MLNFKEGKQKLENLTKLKDFRDKLQEVQKPGKSPTKSVNDAFNNYYQYFQHVAGIMKNALKDKDMANLLTGAGVSTEDIDIYMRYWASLAGKSWAAVSESMTWGYEPEYGPRPLSEIQKIATGSGNDSARLATLENLLGIKANTKSVTELVGAICDRFLHATYKVCEKTEKDLTVYLKEQKMPVTNLLGRLRGEKSFEA